MKTKICVCCGKVLPIDEFGRNKQSSDGRMVTCKECTNKRYRENYRKRKGEMARAGAELKKENDERKSELAKFHARELLEELKSRGYSGEIYYTQKTVF